MQQAAVLDADDPNKSAGDGLPQSSVAHGKDLHAMQAMTKEGTAKEEAASVSLLRFAAVSDYPLLFLGLLGAVVNGGSFSALVVVVGQVFNSLNSFDQSKAEQVCLYFVYIAIGLALASILQVGCLEMFAERTTVRMRQTLLHSLLSQEVAYFDRPEAQQLASLTAELTQNYRDSLGNKLGSLVQNASTFIVGVCVGFSFNWALTLVIIACTPFLAFAGYVTVSSTQKMIKAQVTSYALAGAIAEESFSLIRTITAFGMQRKRHQEYMVHVNNAARSVGEQGRLLGMGFGLTWLFYWICNGVAFWVGAILIGNSRTSAADSNPPNYAATPPIPSYCHINHSIPSQCSINIPGLVFLSNADICNCASCSCGCWPQGISGPDVCLSGGAVVVTFFAVLIGASGLGQAGPGVSAVNAGREAISRLCAIIDRKPSIEEDSEGDGKGKVLERVSGAVSFQNVHFTYPARPDAKILHGLNLEIPAGKRVGVCGQSGSGKSTLVALLERFYDCDEGSVKLDGVDIRDLSLKFLRQQIGLVNQEPVLFATSIRENIRCGRPFTDEQVEKACRDANAHNYIMEFPQGYDTFVGASGSQLSGGQKQRLAIARALLHRPPILLLDEATAALDNQSEALVNEAIDSLLTSGIGTSIVIAHRLSTIRKCDQIVVMDKGRILEIGSHDELVAKPNSMYKSLLMLSEGSAEGKTGSLSAPSNESKARQASEVAAANVNTVADSTADAQLANTISIVEPSAEPEVDKKPTPAKHVSVSRAFQFVKEDCHWLVPGVIGACMSGMGQPIAALCMSRMFAIFFYPVTSDIFSQAIVWGIAFFILGIGHGLGALMMYTFFERVNGRVTARVRGQVFLALLRMDMSFYDSKSNSVGGLTNKLSTDSALVKAALTDRIGLITQNFATMTCGMIIAFVASWKLSLVVLAVFPPMIASIVFENRLKMGLQLKDRTDLQQAAETLNEALAGIRTVHAFGMRDHIQQVYLSQLQGPRERATKQGFIAGVGFGTTQLVMALSYALMFYYGSHLVATEGLTFADFNQALFGVLLSAFALGQAAALMPDVGKGQSAVDSVFEVLDRRPVIDPLSDEGLCPSVVVGEMHLEKATFAYPSRKDVPVWKNLNLTLPAGSTVAIVGSSGSGKSTAVLLMERFYDVDEGVITLDGHDLKELNVGWLREQIGLVSQEPNLFNSSILDNIRNGNPKATDDECFEAARQANAYDFIMDNLPQKFETSCGAKGSQLSGGQKQRIAIARALVHKPAILLLDEATSALDEKGQMTVQKSFRELANEKRRTTLIVAHRLSTVRHADLIVVMEKGRIVEQGTYDELLALDGAFAALLRSQAFHGEGPAAGEEI